jgi:hypothetical protein
LIRDDLESHGVTIADLNPTTIEPPPIASIVVTQSTGDRAVISLKAPRVQPAMTNCLMLLTLE